MSVTEIGQLHQRYVSLADKFKAAWTYNQFASGVYKNLIAAPLPYRVNFQQIYEPIKQASELMQSAGAQDALPLMDASDKRVQQALEQLLTADGQITPSVLRRFFEKLRSQDEQIIFNLIKFYLYAGAIEGAPRDKLDFLFTRMGEDFVEARGEFGAKDFVELRQKFERLGEIMSLSFDETKAAELVSLLDTLGSEVAKVTTFDELTEGHLLKESRDLKHRVGDLFFHPDVLVAIVDCNITTKNRFLKLYKDEEQRLVDDSEKLLENETQIQRGFGLENPALVEELARFKEFKKEFDDSRAASNVKHTVIAQLKTSMNNILGQLERGLDTDSDVEDISDSFLLEAQQTDLVQSRFGNDPLLNHHLLRMIALLDSFDGDESASHIGSSSIVSALRLESWEIDAFQKLYLGRNLGEGETEDLLMFYLRAASLRMKIDEEGRTLADLVRDDAETPMLRDAKASLDRAKQYDSQFKEFLQEGIDSTPQNLRRLYRSRLRLLRAFTGLWLVYDQASGA